MRRSLLAARALAFGLTMLPARQGAALGLDPAFHRPLIGPERAEGVVVWSHGRSLAGEDSTTPTPPYLRVLRDSGWDVLRFDRLREDDSLGRSTRLLVALTARLKRQDYHRIVLAGQSFGGFLALMAADDTDNVDAVIATAPAAFGDFQDSYSTWRLNATRLYPLLARVRRARIMLFFFHDDDFDPGGRGIESRAILARRGLGFAVIDQPAFLEGHWIASSGLFLRRFGDCVRDFAKDDGLAGEFFCHPSWGDAPSAALRLPRELLRPPTAAPALLAAIGGSVPAAAATRTDAAAGDIWYGFYPNGREILLAIEAVHGQELTAIYAIGPGIDRNEPAEWSRRTGRCDGGDMVFAQSGHSTLRFRLRDDGGLAATWISPDGKTKMKGGLRRIDRLDLATRTAANGGQGQ
ncbi:MAG TPA: alpha/beta hydrolase [Stellaceae bacterium]|nr:alpha/beta hydrolase [Stellaceae bacterium]